MLRSIKNIIGYKIQAKDGDIGKVVDFYFDDERWTIRDLVTELGSLNQEKDVLISPAAFSGRPDWAKKEFPVSLTKAMVEKCPVTNFDKPISRQKETELNSYYSWPIYWQQAPGYSAGPMPIVNMRTLKETLPPETDDEGDTRLRSFKEVSQYAIQAKDGKIGHVEDFIIDDERWGIVYMVVDTHILFPGGRVIVALNWINTISWAETEVIVDLSREQIKNSPVYDPATGINRDYENKLYDYYGRPKYW